MKLSGVLTPIPTPFDQQDEVDLPRLRAALTAWLRSPLAGFVILGSNGEAAFLDEDESDRVIGFARELVPKDRAFIVGTGRETTRGTINATRRAAALGADFVLVRTPGFFKSQMTADVFVRHYTAVADASPVPVLLYNVTMFTGVNLPVEAVATLATHPNIVGIKESGSDLAQIADFVARTPDDFTVLAGSATTYFHALCAGCDGGIVALASLFPDECVRLQALVRDHHIDEARALQRRLTPIARTIGTAHGVPALKAALDLLGYTGGPSRPPLGRAPAPVVDTLRTQLAALAALPLVH